MIKALSIKQPFASLIIHGLKPVEIRSWQTSYRGPVLICSGLSVHIASGGRTLDKCNTLLEWDRAFTLNRTMCSTNITSTITENRAIVLHKEIEFPRGGRIGIANLVNVRPMEPSDEVKSFCPYDPTLFAWEFADPTPLPFLKIKGQLSLFNLPDEMAQP